MKASHVILAVMAVCLLALGTTGCAGPQKETAKAYIMQTDTVVEEWDDMTHNAWRKEENGSFSPWFVDDETGTRDEKLERRERKYLSSNVLADKLAEEIGYTRNPGDGGARRNE